MENYQHPRRRKPFKHQEEVFEQSRDLPEFAIFWEQGCVDCETEYLSPTGWRKIADYAGGVVAQWLPGEGRAEFVEPLEYVKRPCEQMLRVKTKYGVDQLLSPNHRVPVIDKGSLRMRVLRADALYEELRQKTFRSFPAVFEMSGGPGLPLSEEQLRLQIAVMADGSFNKNNPGSLRAVLRLKKERKVERIRLLLKNASIEYRERYESETQFFVFSFYAPLRLKVYDERFWQCSKDQLQIICDEVCHWDGAHRSGSRTFFSRHEGDVDFLQYAFSACGQIARKTPHRDVWTLAIRKDVSYFAVRGNHLSWEPSPDGWAYCFVVPSTFLILRRNGCVFPTGNTGKTFHITDLATYLFLTGKIDAVAVVAPTGIHLNWDAPGVGIQALLPEDLLAASARHSWNSSKASTQRHAKAFERVMAHKGGLRWLFMGYDAVITKAGYAALERFLKGYRCLLVLDESARIKNPTAARTRALTKLRTLPKYRRIMTGTPAAQKPFDVYSQVRWMDPKHWADHGIASYLAFKHYFGVWRKIKVNQGREVEVQAVDKFHKPIYKNLDELAKMLKPISSRLLKDDVLDLPPKLYTVAYYELTDKQRAMYDKLEEEFVLFYKKLTEDGQELELTTSADLVLTRQLRLFQVALGYIVSDDGEYSRVDARNPALDLLGELTEDLTRPAIIWARFRRDIDDICAMLGPRAVRYDGTVKAEDRVRAVRAIQSGDAQFFVGSQAAAGEGLTLTEATATFYYSNSRSLTHRLQSEDRNHRIGQKNSVLYTDIIGRNTIAEDILAMLQHGEDVAAMALGDRIKQRRAS